MKSPVKGIADHRDTPILYSEKEGFQIKPEYTFSRGFTSSSQKRLARLETKVPKIKARSMAERVKCCWKRY